MQQVEQDPQKLRDFCDQLTGHASYWQSAITNLDAYMARLGHSWRDEQFNEFAKEVTKLKSSLDEFAKTTHTTVSELRKDAERLEQYQGIQLGR